MQTKVSIITASYNYENYIKETIESVIAQTFQDWEMVIVDDGSKDNSVEIIKSYCEKDSRIKLYQHKNGLNRGLPETVKLGIEKAKGEWIAFLESDDTITPDYLEEKFKIAEKYPEIGFIFNDVNMFGDKEKIQGAENYLKTLSTEYNKYSFPANILQSFINQNPVPTFSCVMLKKNLFDGVKFDFAFKPWLDYYLWTQIAKKNEFYYIDKKLTNWRMHKDSYVNIKASPLQIYLRERQLNKVLYGSKIIYEVLYFLRFIRKYGFRLHLKERKACILGKWHELKI